jgi:hypothetical protein
MTNVSPNSGVFTSGGLMNIKWAADAVRIDNCGHLPIFTLSWCRLYNQARIAPLKVRSLSMLTPENDIDMVGRCH